MIEIPDTDGHAEGGGHQLFVFEGAVASSMPTTISPPDRPATKSVMPSLLKSAGQTSNTSEGSFITAAYGTFRDELGGQRCVSDNCLSRKEGRNRDASAGLGMTHGGAPDERRVDRG